MKSSRIYEQYVKRGLDFSISLIALIVLLPLIILLAIMGTIAMHGSPFFCQPRPGKDEKIFYLIKFRTMTNVKDAAGNLLPDEQRLNGYGKFLRSTSLDELPELWNIFRGDMSLVGPRPQLVRDMVFMSKEQRRRHSVRQGLTGLAQVNGRNSISWEEKIAWDIKYIDDGISLRKDIMIIFKTFGKVFSRADITTDGMQTAEDLGDYLLRTEKINRDRYVTLQAEAKEILTKTSYSK